jgi:hypothetical protein
LLAFVKAILIKLFLKNMTDITFYNESQLSAIDKEYGPVFNAEIMPIADYIKLPK